MGMQIVHKISAAVKLTMHRLLFAVIYEIKPMSLCHIQNLLFSCRLIIIIMRHVSLCNVPIPIQMRQFKTLFRMTNDACVQDTVQNG